VHGAIALSFSEAAILEVVTNMFGEAFKEVNSEVQDAVGELSNMVCGDAQRVLESQGNVFQASIPTVISGAGHSISHSISAPSVIIPFSTNQGHAFFVEASFEEV
jgi:chemotaxis protein CheX